MIKGIKDYHFWVTSPPGAASLDMLKKCSGRASPLLDLRYGETTFKKSLLEKAVVQERLNDLMITIDACDDELFEWLVSRRPADLTVNLCFPGGISQQAASAISKLKAMGCIAGMEVQSSAESRLALQLGAEFLTASGNEAAGPVNRKSSLTLIQEILPGLDIPFFIRGSSGPLGAAAAIAAGCAGYILDTQMLLSPESPISTEWKNNLTSGSVLDASVIGQSMGSRYRFFVRGVNERYNRLMKLESAVIKDEPEAEAKRQELDDQIKALMIQGFSDDANLPPVGHGLIFAQKFAQEGLDVCEILDLYEKAAKEALEKPIKNYAFNEDSPFAEYHHVKFPIVQGPMAGITNKPDAIAPVSKNGALGCIALTGIRAEECRNILKATREKSGEYPFGAGLTLFDESEDVETRIEVVLTEKPDFVILAGGTPASVKQLRDGGIPAYIHAPSPVHIQAFLDEGADGLIWEGREAGGHIGSFFSMELWELGVQELLSRHDDEIRHLRVIIAGGLINEMGAALAAAMLHPLTEKGIKVGLQMGTAYLMTCEAIESKMIPVSFQKALLKATETITGGETVNQTTRFLSSSGSKELLKRELCLKDDGMALKERKKVIEELTEQAWNAAVEEEKTSGNGEEPLLENAGDAESDSLTVISCGEVIAACDESFSIADLHERMTSGGKEVLDRGKKQRIEVSDGFYGDAAAVIGMGCVFPGADSIAQFWDNILRKKCFVKEVPPEVWDANVYYDPEMKSSDKSASRMGAFVEGFEKDPIKFRVAPIAAPSIDIVQFMALEAAYQAMEDAGYASGHEFNRTRTGVVLGSCMGGGIWERYTLRAYWERYALTMLSHPRIEGMKPEEREELFQETEKRFKESLPEFTEESCPGALGCILSARIGRCFDLRGASYTIDGACASAMAALQTALDGLRNGRYDMVLAGAADAAVTPTTFILLSNIDALSDTGSFPFDQRADGFVVGEGAGVVILRRWKDAVKDGDKIYALIRDIGGSNDGRMRGVTAPDFKGQARAIESAYKNIPVTPADISLVEAHGTATPLGDVTEMRSLTRAFSPYTKNKGSVALGSVKSMIGHLKTAAGIAGFIKTVLALHHRILPPTINCEKPRKDIDWENSQFYINREPLPWNTAGRPRRAGVNAFGFGGINFHAVLEEAPGSRKPAFVADLLPTAAEMKKKWPAHVLIFKAKTRRDMIDELKSAQLTFTGIDTPVLSVMSQSASGYPSKLNVVTAIVAEDEQHFRQLTQTAAALLENDSRQDISLAQGIYFSEKTLQEGEKTAFLFPGQGAQYPNMGGDLTEFFPEANEIFDRVDSLAQTWTGHSIKSILATGIDMTPAEKEKLQELLVRTDYNHPALFAICSAVNAVLNSFGIKPDMTAGHSLGEYLALYSAGVFDMETAVKLISLRGSRIYENCFHKGTMAVVRAPAEETGYILDRVTGYVRIANINCPSQTVIAGEEEAVSRVHSICDDMNIDCIPLNVSSAFHTSLLSTAVEPFRWLLNQIDVQPPKIKVQSNTLGKAYPTDGNFSESLREILAMHLVSPVQFINNIESMYHAGARLFVEIGPGAALCSFVDDTLGDRPHFTFPSNQARRSPTIQLLHTLAFCAARGLPVKSKPLKKKTQSLVEQRGDEYRKLKRSESAVARKQSLPAVVREDLFASALTGKNDEEIEEYIQSRREYIKEMIRLDFEHFQDFKPERQAVSKKASKKDVETQVIALISEKTGYPAELIDLNVDVEAELAVDSIKQMEIVRKLEQMYNVDMSSASPAGRYEITTLEELIRKIVSLVPDESPGGEVETRPEEQDQQKGAVKKSDKYNTNTYRFVSFLKKASREESGNGSNLSGKSVIIISDGKGVYKYLSDLISNAGATTIICEAGKIPEITKQSADIIIDLSCLDEAFSMSDEGSDSAWEEWRTRAGILLETAKRFIAVAERQNENQKLWVSVTSMGGDFGAEKRCRFAPLSAVGLGLIRSLASEHPDILEALYIDFDEMDDAQETAEFIFRETVRREGHSEIGRIKGERYEIHWAAEQEPETVNEFELNAESIILVTGGARGITASLCLELAQKYQCRMVIIGRSRFKEQYPASAPLEYEEAFKQALKVNEETCSGSTPFELEKQAWRKVWESERNYNINRMKEAGSEVEYYACDLTDMPDVKETLGRITAKYGRIDVVVHGAGGLFEKSVLNTTGDEFEEGFKPKGLGTLNLVAALKEVKLKAFVNLSSIVGRWGYMGLSSYAAGHEISCSAVAAARNERKRSGIWINLLYGPWLKKGMTRQGSTMERLHQKGAAFITESDGFMFFHREILAGKNSTAALRGKEPAGLFQPVESGETPLPQKEKKSLVEIERKRPGEALGRIDLNPEENEFLNAHLTDGAFHMPVSYGLEMLAQTAEALLDSKVVIKRIVNLEVQSNIVMTENNSLKLYAEVRRIKDANEPDAFKARLYSPGDTPGSMNAGEMTHISCSLVFSENSTSEVSRIILPENSIATERIDISDIWNTKLMSRYKGIYNNIDAVASISPDGFSAEVHPTANRPEYATKSLGDLIRLESLFFASDIYAACMFSAAGYSVKKVDVIEFIQPNNKRDAQTCRIFIRQSDVSEQTCRIEAADEMGRTSLRIYGLVKTNDMQKSEEKTDERIWDELRTNRKDDRMRRILGLDEINAAHVRIASVGEAVNGGRQREVLKFYLSEEELKRLDMIRHPKRRAEWTAGRIAAKTAIRQLLNIRKIMPSDISIGNGPNGAPFAQGSCFEETRPPFISISHSADVAVAATSYSPVGIDVELMTISLDSHFDDFCDAKELKTVRQAAEFTEKYALTLLWTAKESAVKLPARGKRLLKEIELLTVKPDGEYMIFEFDHPDQGTVKSVALQKWQYAYAVSRITETFEKSDEAV